MFWNKPRPKNNPLGVQKKAKNLSIDDFFNFAKAIYTKSILISNFECQFLISISIFNFNFWFPIIIRVILLFKLKFLGFVEAPVSVFFSINAHLGESKQIYLSLLYIYFWWLSLAWYQRHNMMLRKAGYSSLTWVRNIIIFFNVSSGSS